MTMDLGEKKENNFIESKISKNSQNSQEIKLSKKNVFNILKLLLLIFSISIFSFFVFLGAMFFIAPKVDAKIFNFFGIKSAEEACYKQVYKKSNSNADLYNLILFEKQIKNYEKELEYINELKGKSDYKEFCKKMDLTGLDYCQNNKNQYIYFADVNAYFEARKVICKFNLNVNKGINYNILLDLQENLGGDDLTEYSIFEYVNLVLTTDSLTKTEKTNLIKKVSENSIIELVIERINNIENKIDTTTDEVELILLQNSLVNHLKSVYYYEIMLNDRETETAVAFKNQYKIEFEKYLTLAN